MPVVLGAQLMCSFGVAPSSLVVLPADRVLFENKPVATMLDSKPLVNIMPFGMCTSLANPTVASATAAALGVLTPMPCVPATAAPWAPPLATVLIGNKPAITNTAKCMCNWGGVIQILNPGATKELLP